MNDALAANFRFPPLVRFAVSAAFEKRALATEAARVTLSAQQTSTTDLSNDRSADEALFRYGCANVRLAPLFGGHPAQTGALRNGAPFTLNLC